MIKYILWDFDGVLVNSMEECLVNSYNAYIQYEGESLIDRPIFKVPAVNRAHFLNYRKFVRPAGEYYLLHKSLDEKADIHKFQGFEAYAHLNEGDVRSFQKIFFEKREEIRSNNLDQWLNLHHLYLHIADAWRALKQDFSFLIVSNKDRKSIELLLDHFGLRSMVDEIFGSDFSNDKRLIIQHIIDTKNISPGNILFIDDHFGHLADVKELGIHLGFANWGFGSNVPEVHFEHTILTPGNLVKKIKSIF
jgi:phosphoglycolate phosphatase-like HAD superfamily hydrolase